MADGAGAHSDVDAILELARVVNCAGLVTAISGPTPLVPRGEDVSAQILVTHNQEAALGYLSYRDAGLLT